MAEVKTMAATAGNAAKSSRRKRKRTDDQQLDPAERLRRQKQRQAQALALKLRAEGKDTRTPKKYKQPSTSPSHAYTHDAASQKKSRNGSAKHRVQATQQEPYKEETGFRPEGDVQVVIVPIFWNKKADEKATVLAAAEEVQEQLQVLGITVGLDSTNADTPGQKYRYWEEKGVKVRVELGPRDAQKSQACLAISSTPGQVAKKDVFQIGVPLTEAVQKALNTVGISSKAVPANKVAGGKHNLDSKSKPSKKQKQANVADAVAQDDVAPAGVSQSGKVASKAVKHSGDDLGDEFDVEVEAAEDEGNQKRKKKKGSLKAGSLKDEKSNKPKAKAHKVIRF